MLENHGRKWCCLISWWWLMSPFAGNVEWTGKAEMGTADFWSMLKVNQKCQAATTTASEREVPSGNTQRQCTRCPYRQHPYLVNEKSLPATPIAIYLICSGQRRKEMFCHLTCSFIPSWRISRCCRCCGCFLCHKRTIVLKYSSCVYQN